MSLVPDMRPAWELREHLKQRDDTITALRAEVEAAHRREACAVDLAREWESHCKTAEAGVARLRAENERLRAALREIVTCNMYSTRPWDIARAALDERQ